VQEQKVLMFMPWCPIEKEYSAGEYQLVPFDLHKRHTGEGAEIRNYLGPYKTINGNSLQKVCLLRAGKGPIIRSMSDSELENAFQFAELACFCSLSEREPCSDERYVNRDCFTMYAQRFQSGNYQMALKSRRMDGYSFDLQEGSNIVVSNPVHCRFKKVMINEKFLQALCKIFATSQHTNWQYAITCFNWANTDSPKSFNYMEWPLLDSAFEQVLGKNIKMRSQKFAEFFLGDSLVDNSDIKESIPYKWMCDFRKIRNQFAHGNLHPKLPPKRGFLEELLLARMSFPLLLKMCLHKDKRYDLSPHERASIKILFGEFSEIPNFLQPPMNAKNNADSHWRRHHSKLSGRIALEDFLRDRNF